MLVKIAAIGPWGGVLRSLTISLKMRNGIHVLASVFPSYDLLQPEAESFHAKHCRDYLCHLGSS